MSRPTWLLTRSTVGSATLSTLTAGEFVSTHDIFMLEKVTMVGTVAACYTCRRFSPIYSSGSLSPGGVEVVL